MKIKPILADMSGRLQGIVASHNRGGQYFRGRTVPITPPTAPQTAVRLLMSNLVDQWTNVIISAQREAWNEFAVLHPQVNSFGDSVNIGGLGAFIRQNLSRTLAGLAVVQDPPAGSGVAALTLPSGVENSDNLDVSFDNGDNWATNTSGALLVFASNPVPLSRISAAGISKRFVGAILGAGTPPTSPETITLPFIFAAGRIFVKYRAVDSLGGISAVFEQSVDHN